MRFNYHGYVPVMTSSYWVRYFLATRNRVHWFITMASLSQLQSPWPQKEVSSATSYGVYEPMASLSMATYQAMTSLKKASVMSQRQLQKHIPLLGTGISTNLYVSCGGSDIEKLHPCGTIAAESCRCVQANEASVSSTFTLSHMGVSQNRVPPNHPFIKHL